jgi:citrate synthase
LDPLWKQVDSDLKRVSPELWNKIDLVTRTLHGHGKRVFPNPSAYTSASSIALGVPEAITAFVFVAGRLPGWAKLSLDLAT